MKKKDQLTLFMAKELLYDYAKGLLKDERKQSFEELLKESGELRLALKSINERIERLEEFDRLEVSEDLIKELSLPHPSLAQQLASIERRFAPQFWRALPLGVLVLAGVVAISIFKPWNYLGLNEVEVAKISMSDDDYRMEAAIALSEKDIEGAMKAQTEKDPEEVVEAPSDMVKSPDDKASSEKEVASAPKEKAKRVGYIYRGFMTVDNLSQVTQSTVDKIQALGGKKAGQVPLGWNRDEDERYFHFSIPEKNKKALLDHLSNFSQVRLSSQEHPLVMPEGKIRIILVVKQNPNVVPKEVEATPPPPLDPAETEESDSSVKEEASP
ncbi:MAG: hypothetical protein GW917_01515 [Bdellovibrionales bacterium]|nr:hypothetical protein [Bdellovibrionales bacterium]